VRCCETILLTADEYERIRADGTTFAIAPGHRSQGNLAEDHESYLVVRTTEDAGEVVRARDPRREDA